MGCHLNCLQCCLLHTDALIETGKGDLYAERQVWAESLIVWQAMYLDCQEKCCKDYCHKKTVVVMDCGHCCCLRSCSQGHRWPYTPQPILQPQKYMQTGGTGYNSPHACITLLHARRQHNNYMHWLRSWSLFEDCIQGS